MNDIFIKASLVADQKQRYERITAMLEKLSQPSTYIESMLTSRQETIHVTIHCDAIKGAIIDKLKELQKDSETKLREIFLPEKDKEEETFL